MVKTVLSALVVAGLAATANASSITKAGETAGKAISADTSSSVNGTTAAVTNGGKNVSESKVLGSLKASSLAVSARMKAVLSSQEAPLKGTDFDASVNGTTNAKNASSADVTSAGQGVSGVSEKSAAGISNAETSATTSAAAKKAGEKVVSASKAVSAKTQALAREIWAGLVSTYQGSAAYSTNVSQALGNLADSSTAGTTNISNALSVRDAVAAMIEMQNGEWNSNRDFEKAFKYFLDEAALAGYTAAEALAAFDAAVAAL